jgi:hypothetical protein
MKYNIKVTMTWMNQPTSSLVTIQPVFRFECVKSGDKNRLHCIVLGSNKTTALIDNL